MRFPNKDRDRTSSGANDLREHGGAFFTELAEVYLTGG
jgi:hypothetical protein